PARVARPPHERERDEEQDRDHDQLATYGGRDQRRDDCGDRPPPCPHHERLRDQEETERGIRIGEVLLDDPAGVRERRNDCRPGRREERPGLRHDHPREEVRREQHRRHHEDVEVLHARIRRRDVVDQPDGRRQHDVERMEAVRFAAPGGVARVGDRARELRQLELVREEPRRRVLPRFDAVDDAEPDVDARERDGRERTVCDTGTRADGRADLVAAARPCKHAHSATAPSTAAGSRSTRRWTKRQEMSARRQASTIASSRSRGAVGIVTSTASGSWRPRIQPIWSIEPSTGTPWIRRVRKAGSSSTNPTTRSPGVSRSSRSRLRPLRPAPTMSVRLPLRLPTNSRSACATPRSQKRAMPIRSEQSIASMRNVPRGKPPHGVVPQMKKKAAASDSTTAETIAAASRAPAYRQTPRYRPKTTKKT